jgi:predicted transglutaminase-like cysteine proteinase
MGIGRNPPLPGAWWLLFLLLCFAPLMSCTKAPPVAPYVPPPPLEVPVPPEPEPTKAELWRNLVLQYRSSPVEVKLATVNRFFNEFDFVDDMFLWGREDYWATLHETLARSAGDCEDITIAKYFTLKNLDIPVDSMRLTYVIAVKTGKPHIVLTFQPGPRKEPLVLDTMHNFLFPVSRRRDLVPVYSFNEKGLWVARLQEGWQGETIGSPAGITAWRQLLRRMQKTRYVYSEG